MRIITVVNQKGGVAKSTTAVNVATAMALMGYKTLVIDLDPQSNASQWLDKIAFDRGTPYLFENTKSTLAKAVNETEIKNLFIVPSDLSLSQVEWELWKKYKPAHITILKEKIKTELEFDYCLIDCPPSLGLFSMNALMAADRVLIPVTSEPFALVGLKYLSSTVNEFRMGVNKGLQILGIARTIWESKPNLSQDISDSLEQDYPGKVLKTIIKKYVRVKESAVHKKPVVVYDPNCLASIQYTELTREVLKKWEQKNKGNQEL